MPYATNTQLPKKQTDQYSGHQKSAFREAFNTALKTYGSESQAFAVAHSAAKRAPPKKRAS
jgi:cation transport regulator ChaB